MNGVLSELANLLAVGFLEEGDSLAVMDQGAITTAYDQSGNVLAIVTIGTGDSDRWARSAGDEDRFVQSGPYSTQIGEHRAEFLRARCLHY